MNDCLSSTAELLSEFGALDGYHGIAWFVIVTDRRQRFCYFVGLGLVVLSARSHCHVLFRGVWNRGSLALTLALTEFMPFVSIALDEDRSCR